MKTGLSLSCITVLLGLLYLRGEAGDRPEQDKPQARKLQIEVETHGHGLTKDTRYRLPIENGTVTVGEYTHQRGIRASDGVAGFRTYVTEHGARASHLFISGTKHRTEYIDIDGDGLLDALWNHSADALFILVEGRWVEVAKQKVGFSDGDRRTTTAEPRRTYVFRGSTWVGE